jgi:hypothetical protein
VPTKQCLRFTLRRKLLEAKLTDRFQKTEAGLTVHLRLLLEQALIHERGDLVQNILLRLAIPEAHRCDGRQCAAANKDRHAAE